MSCNGCGNLFKEGQERVALFTQVYHSKCYDKLLAWANKKYGK